MSVTTHLPDSSTLTQQIPPPAVKVASFPQTLTTALRVLNERVVYVRSRSMIADLTPRRGTRNKIPLISCAAFKNEAFANMIVDRYSVPDRWLKWTLRREVDEIVYAPGQARFTPDGNLNSWFPSTSVPKAGDIALFHQYLAGMMENDPLYLDWVTHWLAFHLQHPDKKQLQGVIFWSSEQGNGKSTLGFIMRHIVGLHNSYMLRNSFPHRFNSYAENIQFLWMDELNPVRKADRQEEIKAMITQPRISIENKGQRPYEMDDLISYYFTSNHPNALDLKDDDRRFFIHNVGRNSLSQTWFDRCLYPWLRTQSAIDAIHHYLLNEVDLSKPIVGGDPYSLTPRPYSHTAYAPRNDARVQMIADNRDDIESWLYDLKETPETILGESSAHRTLFTSEELWRLYREATGDTRSTSQTFRIRLGSCLTKLCAGQPIRLDEGRLRIYTTDPAKSALDMAQVRLCWAQEQK